MSEWYLEKTVSKGFHSQFLGKDLVIPELNARIRRSRCGEFSVNDLIEHGNGYKALKAVWKRIRTQYPHIEEFYDHYPTGPDRYDYLPVANSLGWLLMSRDTELMGPSFDENSCEFLHGCLIECEEKESVIPSDHVSTSVEAGSLLIKTGPPDSRIRFYVLKSGRLMFCPLDLIDILGSSKKSFREFLEKCGYRYSIGSTLYEFNGANAVNAVSPSVLHEFVEYECVKRYRKAMSLHNLLSQASLSERVYDGLKSATERTAQEWQAIEDAAIA